MTTNEMGGSSAPMGCSAAEGTQLPTKAAGSADEKKPPRNPFYKFEFVFPTSSGHARVQVDAPLGELAKKDAETLSQWFELIIRYLEGVAINKSGS